ncbi:MAG TPA: RNA polymerase sigma-70 factor, partial [Pedobacter sp.]
ETVFRFIYDKYWEKLFFVASKRLNNTYEAEEVVQEVFFNLWNKREKFELRNGFENYLAVAVKYEVYKRRSLRLRRENLSQDLLQHTDHHENYDANLYDLHELRKKLDETINSLPPKCRLVFTMSRNSDLTNKGIANELGISEKSVEKHISHAIKILKGRFGVHFSVLLLHLGRFSLPLAG